MFPNKPIQWRWPQRFMFIIHHQKKFHPMISPLIIHVPFRFQRRLQWHHLHITSRERHAPPFPGWRYPWPGPAAQLSEGLTMFNLYRRLRCGYPKDWLRHVKNKYLDTRWYENIMKIDNTGHGSEFPNQMNPSSVSHVWEILHSHWIHRKTTASTFITLLDRKKKRAGFLKIKAF